MKKLILLLFPFLIAGMQLAQAQGVVIKGKIIQSTGEPLPGVTIIVKGTTVGALSQADGTYMVTIPSGGTILAFSSIGYESQEIAISGRTVIDVALKESSLLLSEIVITGYSVERKKDIIGSVSIVNTSEMLTTPAGNVSAMLQGRVSGLTVTTDGSVNNATKIRIRGFGSFGGSDPLYIIDGVPGSVSRLNPNDIESVQVLKDAASAAVYGARAANGVIIITTRHGKKGAVKFNIDSYSGVNYFSKNNFPDMLDAQELGDAYWRAMKGAGRKFGDANWTHPQYGNGPTPVIPEYILVNDHNSRTGGFVLEQLKASDPAAFAAIVDPAKYDLATYQIVKSANTNWFDEVFNPAPIKSLQTTASGGSDHGTYAVGLSYFDQKNTSDKYSYYTRYTIRANTTLNIKKFLRFGENLQVSYNEGRDVSSPSTAWTMQAILPVYDIMGNPAGSAAPNVVSAGGSNGFNPIGQAWRNRFDKNWTYGIFGNAFVDIILLKDLVIHSSFGIDYSNYTNKNMTQVTYEYDENITAPNSLAWSMNNAMSWTFSNTLNYSKTLGSHSMKILLGTEALHDYYINVIAMRQNFLIDNDDNYLVLDAATGSQSNGGTFTRAMLYSFFGRLDYAFSDKYLFNVTIRRDGSSKFGTNYRYGYFPSAAIGWRVTNEKFMQGLTWLADLKLRASYGIIGNQNGLSNENQYSTVQQLIGNSYPLQGTNNTIMQSYMTSRAGNPDARWEKSISTNIGFDASLFDGGTSVIFDYFIRETKDLLVANQAPYTGMNVTQPSVNVGSIRNKGVDLTIIQRAKIAGQIDFEASVNFSAYKNMVLKVLDNPEATLAGVGGVATVTGEGGRMGNPVLTKAGYPIAMFYGYKLDGFYNSQQEVDDYLASNSNNVIPAAIGRWRISDVSGPDGVPDNVINDYDRTFLGSPHPDFQVGLNLSLAYKGFDFSGFLFWNQGGDIFNYSLWESDFQTFQYNRSHRFLYDSWTPELGKNALLPKLDLYDTYSNKNVSSYFVEDATYLRMKTLQLGYTIPANMVDKINVDKIRVYVQAQNIFTLSKFRGTDPGISISGGDDLTMGVVNNYTPTPKQILFGISIGF